MKMRNVLKGIVAGLALLVSANQADARVVIDLTNPNSEPLPVAMVPFDGASSQERKLGRQMREVIRNNLANTGLFDIVSEQAHLQSVQSLRTSGIIHSEWRLLNVEAVLLGRIQFSGGSAGVTPQAKIHFFLYDPYAEDVIISKVYTADARFWRHLAHRISDDIYSKLTGESGYFTTRVVHIAEERDKSTRETLKKLCVMDQDGGNYQCLTDGRHLVLTPRFNPAAQKIVYMSYENGLPRLYLLDLPTGKQEIVGNFEGLNSSPRFSPDGSKLVMTLTKGHAGNPEVYSLDLKTRKLKRLTFHRGIDTSPSFSPDGKRIVFNSNRGGKPALYTMDTEGNNVKRLTFAQGRHFAPVWSPRGDYIAFVKEYKGKFSIAVVDSEGDEVRQLTESFLDESPTWSPNGRVIAFSRQVGDDTKIYTVDITGYNVRELKTPTNASDPAWSPLLK